MDAANENSELPPSSRLEPRMVIPDLPIWPLFLSWSRMETYSRWLTSRMEVAFEHARVIEQVVM